MTTKKIILVVLVVIVLGYLIYPKNVGGPMCGPLCPSVGLHTYSQFCLGIKITDTSMTDSFAVNCYGLPIGEKKCYGVPYINTIDFNFKDSEMDCNYPCNDNSIRNKCQIEETLTFQGVTINCQGLKQQCNW